MPYTKKIWRRNEIITEDGLNHIETGIEANDTAIKKALQRDIVEANIQKVGPTETSRAEIVQKENGSSLNLIISKDVDENIIQTEEGRVRAEEKRVEAEQSRVLAEAERKKAEAARVLSENKRQQATDAAVAKTEEATQAAVAKAQTATDNATTAANKAEAAVSKLPLPLGNTLKGKVEATLVNVDDAYPAPLVTTKVLGQSNQVTTTGKNLIKLDEVIKTSQGLELDIKSNGQLSINGTCTGGGLWLKIGTVDVVEGKTYYLSLNKPFQSFGISAWSDTDNKHVIFAASGQQVAKGVAAKTETLSIFATSGSNVTFNNERIYLQIEEGQKTNWEPYTGGKPSPSPDYPQEITNLNKAELVITGRNICPDAELLGKVVYNSGIPTNKYGIQANFPYVQQSETDGIGAVLNTIKGITYSIAYLGKANTAAVGIAEYKSVDDVGDISKVVSYARVGSSKKISLTASIDGVMVFVLASQWSNGTTNLNTFAKEDMIISVGEPCSTYTPHQSNSTVIDLKGNELLSIPNGVRDEVVIDAEGNVSLIKRIGISPIPNCISISDTASQAGTDGTTNYLVAFGTLADVKIGNGMSCMCNKFTDGGISKNRDTVRLGANNNNVYVYTSNEQLLGDKSLAHIDNWMKSNEVTIIYQLAEPQTIPLGKVELPALPESTSNVWNDGNIPANVYIQYLKDVNIAYGKLES